MEQWIGGPITELGVQRRCSFWSQQTQGSSADTLLPVVIPLLQVVIPFMGPRGIKDPANCGLRLVSTLLACDPKPLAQQEIQGIAQLWWRRPHPAPDPR